MAFIVQTLLSDNRIQLGCEEYTRPFSFGTNWTKIRLAIRWAIWSTRSIITFPAGPFIGVSQGSAGLISNSTIDYVGITPNWSGANHLTWSNTSPQTYVQPSNGLAMIRKVGAVVTYNQSNSVNYNFPANPSLYLAQTMVEITKISPTGITCNLFSPGTAEVLIGVSRESFLTNVEMASPTNCTTASAVNFGISSNMLWDTACLAWQHTTPTIEVADFVVVRQL